jgi:predicted metal-dependent hydrolase
LLRAIEEFNRGQFFECHETLEELWKEESRPVRDLYQGVLQIGVGFYHLKRGNYRGAVLSLGRGVDRLRPLPPVCQGVLVGRMVADAERALVALRGLAPGQIADLDSALNPKIQVGGESRD